MKDNNVMTNVVDTWTAGETRSFLSHVSHHRLYPLYLLALSTDMRLGELLGLKWEDIDWNKQMISLAGRPERIIMLSRQLVAELRKYHKRQQEESILSELVFVSRSGGPLNPRMLSLHLRITAARAGLPVLSSFYSLRRTHVSLLSRGLSLANTSLVWLRRNAIAIVRDDEVIAVWGPQSGKWLFRSLSGWASLRRYRMGCLS